VRTHKRAFFTTSCEFCESLDVETYNECRKLSASKESPNKSDESDESDKIEDAVNVDGELNGMSENVNKNILRKYRSLFVNSNIF